VHLLVLITQIYHDARSTERQTVTTFQMSSLGLDVWNLTRYVS